AGRMIATRTIASNCLQHLGARMFAVSILEPVSNGGGAGSSQRKRGRPLGGIGSAAERRKRAVPPFAAIEAERAPAGTTEGGNPHFACNKTIPCRFVLVHAVPRLKCRSHAIVSGKGADERFLWKWTGRGSMAQAHRRGTA